MTPAEEPEPAGPYRYRHHPLLGTFVEVRVAGDVVASQAEHLDEVVRSEMARLEGVFSAFDSSSELERWKRGERRPAGAELSAVLALALDWQLRSEGAFNPACGVLTALWQGAEARGRPPTDAELADAAASIREPRYVLDATGAASPVGTAAGVNLNAYVKGWIVDRAVEAAFRAAGAGLDLLVSAGGDLRHRGGPALPVGIENPLRPYDNEPPLATVWLGDAALATSGRARRGFLIGGRWYGHVLDPRTGRTVDEVASISVVASDAATADVLATVIGVNPPSAAPSEADRWGVACLAVDVDGTCHRNDRWRDLERRP